MNNAADLWQRIMTTIGVVSPVNACTEFTKFHLNFDISAAAL
jgi:hypothetical protein